MACKQQAGAMYQAKLAGSVGGCIQSLHPLVVVMLLVRPCEVELFTKDMACSVPQSRKVREATSTNKAAAS